MFVIAIRKSGEIGGVAKCSGTVLEKLHSPFQFQPLPLFVRVYGAPATVNTVDFYGDLGVNYTGLIPGREADVLGVAFGSTWISRDFSDASVAGGGRSLGQESVLEITYKAQLTPWWFVQSDLQFTLDPSAVQGSGDVLILGLRTGITF